MRVGLLTQWYPPEPGPAALPGALARGLAARGHQVEVVTGFPNYPDGVVAPGYRVRARTVEEEGAIRVTRVALYPSHADSRARRLANYGSFAAAATVLGLPSAFGRLDALWVNYSPVTVALPMLAQQKLRHTPSVVHVLDLWPDTLHATGFSPGGGLVGRAALGAVGGLCDAMYRSAGRVAYISPGVGRLLASRGVAESKLAYAPMWANEEIYLPRPSPVSRDFGLSNDDVALVYAGSLGRAQGLETLVAACARVRELPFVCLIAGSGTEEQHLRGLADRLDARNVRFLGRLPESSMPALMSASDVNYISLNADPLSAVTMPSKLQAVMASARPVIGSLTGDAAGVIADAHAGWVVRPGDVDGLAATLRDAVTKGRQSLEQAGRRAREHYVREFGYTHGVDRIEGLLADVSRRGR